MTNQEINKEKEIIMSQYKKYAPELHRLLKLEMKLGEYSASLYDFSPKSEHLKRQELIKNVIRNKLRKLFGENCEEDLRINLSGGLAFNIADHHQVLNHPLLLSSNIISSVGKIGKENKQEAIIVISSGDVPPNNFFSRNGFSFHDKKVPLFSNSEREFCSYYIPKRNFDLIDRMKRSDVWKNFDSKEREFLSNLSEEMKSYDYSRCKNYIDQITIINQNTWPNLFEEKLRENIPNLIYLAQEEIVIDCLIKLLREDNFFGEMLFSEKTRENIINNFRGIVVTWKESEGKGTHFFWRKYPGRPQSLRMYAQGGKLVPADGRFSHLAVSLERNEVIDLLEKKEIYPSLFMIFAVLNYYSGIKPLVGYGSVQYLHLMKEAWKKTLLYLGDEKEKELLDSVETNGLIAGLPFYFKRYNGKLKTLYARDIFYEGGIEASYLEKAFNMPVSDFFQTSIAEMYDYYSQNYVPQEERIKPRINSDILAEMNFQWI